MQISDELLTFIGEKGLLLSAILSALYLLSWRLDKTMWASELSKGEIKGNSKAYTLYWVVFFAVSFIMLLQFDRQLIELDMRMNQITMLVVNCFIFGFHVLVDILVLDLLLYSKLQPRFMKIEGVDYISSSLFHLDMAWRMMLIGAFFCFLASIIA